MREEAKKKLKIQEENKVQFDKKRKQSRKYEVGDFIAIKMIQFDNAMKLKDNYLGPYEIISAKNHDR